MKVYLIEHYDGEESFLSGGFLKKFDAIDFIEKSSKEMLEYFKENLHIKTKSVYTNKYTYKGISGISFFYKDINNEEVFIESISIREIKIRE